MGQKSTKYPDVEKPEENRPTSMYVACALQTRPVVEYTMNDEVKGIVMGVLCRANLNTEYAMKEIFYTFHPMPKYARTRGIEIEVAEKITLTELAKGLLCGQEQHEPATNFLLKLIANKDDEKSHVKMALQFLRAMVQRPAEWSDYIRLTLSVSRAECEDNRGNGLLHEAVKSGSCKLLEEFLDDSSVNIVNSLGETALHLAAEFGHDDDVEFLLYKGAVIKADLCGRTPLHSAALSLEPNPKVAKRLLDAMKSQPDLKNAQSNDDLKETALHCAAGNRNVTTEFIEELRDLDPLPLNGTKDKEDKDKDNEKDRNTAFHISASKDKDMGNDTALHISASVDKYKDRDRDTAFHISASMDNPDIFLAMITTFAPTKCGWDIDDVDRQKHAMVVGSKDDDDDKDEKHDLLLHQVARSGNAKGVAALIQNGANISKGVFHVIVMESIKHPEKVDKLKEVYEAIVNNAVLWEFLEKRTKCPREGSEEYSKALTRIMHRLTTEVPENYKDKNDTNVIEFAIELGAHEMLVTIFNTPDVYRFDHYENGGTPEFPKSGLYSKYDVTNFITAEPGNEPAKQATRPKDPYLTSVINNYDQWKDKNILMEQPFRQLMRPFVVFVQRLYLVLGAIQMAHMIWFSSRMIPIGEDNCSVIVSNNDNRTYCNETVTPSEANGFIVWPCVLCACNVITLLVSFAKIITGSMHCQKNLRMPKTVDLLTNFAVLLADKSPTLAFCISVFVWRATDAQYVEASMVLLFGWITNFVLISGITKRLYVFSIMLRETVVKDILKKFLLVFVFAVVSFSFCLYVLGHKSNLHDTVFDVFVVPWGVGGDGVSDAGKDDLYRVVFDAYMVFTATIILNILIAMVGQRYDKAKTRAENEWRFQVTVVALVFHDIAFLRRLIRVENYKTLHVHVNEVREVQN